MVLYLLTEENMGEYDIVIRRSFKNYWII